MPVPTFNSSMNIYSSGGTYTNQSVNLYSTTYEVLSSNLELYVGGRTTQYNDETVTLFVQNLAVDSTASGGMILFSKNKATDYDTHSDQMSFFTRGVSALFSRLPNASLPLFVNTNTTLETVYSDAPLFTMGEDLTYTLNSGTLSLFTINYPAVDQTLDTQATITWNGGNVGKSINVDDNKYSFLKANDEIRGVELMCYGDCPDGTCKELSVTTHNQTWSFGDTCIDGGIFRASQTYTNLAVSGFNTPIGYSGHFYGIRKYDGLIPNAPYKIVVAGKTGDKTTINVPSELQEIEYGNNSYVGYSGVKLTSNNRELNEQYGQSVSVKKDVMAVGSPFTDIYDSGNYLLEDAGSVYIYKRNPRPTSSSWPAGEDKSKWVLDTKLTLPSGYLRDSYTENKRSLVAGMEQITERFWEVGQEGRQFGHSVSLSVNENEKSLGENSRQILAVGGPSAKWSRTFDTLKPSGVSIGLMIFTDEFTPNIGKLSYFDILQTIKGKDLVFKYFSQPSVMFDVKLIILEPLADVNRSTQGFPEPQPTFITKAKIHRNQGLVNNEQTSVILQDIKNAFHTAFPYDTSKLNNNIPPILGFYVDGSRSLGRQSVSPALDQFVSYFKEYSFASGLRDFYNVRTSGAVTEYVPRINSSEDWIGLSNIILEHTLDTGRLVREDQVKLFSSGVGTQFFNNNLEQFNNIPTSGGKVYIFEKESGSWNLIQQINSPVISYGQPDRFGHAVAISDNAEVVAVGSPYIDEALNVYEYKPEEKDRLYAGLENWLVTKGSIDLGLGRYTALLNEYRSLQSNDAAQTIYLKLTPTDKFEIRQTLNINEYQNIHTYRYSDINILGTWNFIPEAFAPTSRLGYSVAVNNDGSIVAVGCPTDSFNQWDDGNVYYKNNGYGDPFNIDNINGAITQSWTSNTNAGAIRVFDSRKYYPHSGVVEFTKFGNLEESQSDPAKSVQFSYLSQIFSDKNFKKTSFSDVKIPQSAGLAFIITPEVDALSDEVVSNIVQWLSLGDRNLVLVGNDPTWEKNGAYAPSNDIINRLLAKLNSRMRLYPARTQSESLPYANTQDNILPSFKPAGITATYSVARPLIGSGVADIRMHHPNFYMSTPCDDLNTKCQPPLKDGGDLRSQWYSQCESCDGISVVHEFNWPYIFGSYKPPQCCSTPNDALKNQEPIPLLVAGEYTEPTSITYPAVPPSSGLAPIYSYIQRNTFSKKYKFDENTGGDLAFIWTSDSGNYLSLNTNIGNSTSEGRFYTPEPFGDKKSLLQSVATPKTEARKNIAILSNISDYCAEEYYEDTLSKIVLISNTSSESSEALYSGAGDANINFYANLVSKTVNGEATIAQLGGWTGRVSFTDAYNKSILREVFNNTGNSTELNVDTLYDRHDICWIANPINLPNSDQLNALTAWLSGSNKKLVITYDSTAVQANLISQLCDLLNISMKPFYLPVDDMYAEVASSLTFNTSSYVSTGFAKYPITFFDYPVSFIPLKLGTKSTRICFANVNINDSEYTSIGYWQMKSGVTKVTFPVTAGSGYKLFIETERYSITETEPLQFTVSNINANPQIPYPLKRGQNPILDIDISNDKFYSVESNSIGYAAPNSSIINVQIPSGVSAIDVYISCNSLKLTSNPAFAPKSERLIGISGVTINVIEETVVTPFTEQVIDGYQYVQTSPGLPATTVITPSELRPISTDNTKYCSTPECAITNGGQLIADGPVVAAQEIEAISSFNTGYARSRITVLGDSSFVQGPTVANSNGVINNNNRIFLRSLFPETYFRSDNSGRQYDTMTKIVAPERMSPQKLYSMIGNTGVNTLFSTINPRRRSLDVFDDKESRYSPDYVGRTNEPWNPEDDGDAVEAKKKAEIAIFNSQQRQYGATAKISGVIDGVLYSDASMYGGMPQIMKDKGYDYLDFIKLPSGYRGDLFGYSISLDNDKLVVGTPFTPFSQTGINAWNYYVNGGVSSGILSSYNGGAGAAYVFEKTFKGSGIRNTTTPWQYIQKLRPNTINIGQDLSSTGTSQSDGYLGNNNYTSQELSLYSSVTDQFGYDVDINSDVIIVGAPGHDFSNYSVNGTGQFIRKAFNGEFNIPSRAVYDLGSSGNRTNINSSGSVLNNGAIFVFENRIVDWPTKTQKWTLVEKVVPMGANSRVQKNSTNIPSGCENDNFGKSISLDHSYRTDADYTIVGGSPYHVFDSGSNSTTIKNAGSIYTFDAMLRKQIPAFASPNSYINARIFGDDAPFVKLNIQNNNLDNIRFYASGLVYSNNQGEIFLEVSGQDPVSKGFIQHRPYIESIDGQYLYGSKIEGGIMLSIYGKQLNTDKNLDMFISVADSAIVYNTLGLYESAVIGYASGIPSGLGLYLNCPYPSTISASGFTLYTSGIGLNTDTLNMRIRGK